MILDHLSLFSIPVTYGSIGADCKTLNDALVEDILHEVSLETEKRSGTNVLQTKTGLENKYESFNFLKGVLDVAANECFKYSNVKTEACTREYWGNYNNENIGSFHMPHTHSLHGYIFTGVYFPHGDEASENFPLIKSESNPEEGSLVLLDPLEFVKSAICDGNIDRYPFFGLPISIKPKSGAFIIFPSYISHMVIPMTRKEKRFSIAFNVKQK